MNIVLYYKTLHIDDIPILIFTRNYALIRLKYVLIFFNNIKQFDLDLIKIQVL